MLTCAPVMESDACFPSEGLFGSCVHEGVEGVYFTGSSAHHLLLKAAVAIAAKAVQHARMLLE